MSDTSAVSSVDILRALMTRHDPTTEQYGQRLLRDAVDAGDTLQILRIYRVMGLYYANAAGNLPKALEYAELADRMLAEYKVPALLKAEVCLMIAGVYRVLAQYHKSIQYCNEALAHMESIEYMGPEDVSVMVDLHVMLCILQQVLGLNRLAMASISKALSYAERSGDRKSIIRCKMSIAKQFVIEKKHEEALKIYREILPEEELLTSDENRAIFRDYLGGAYKDTGNYDLAEKYLLESLEIRERGLQRFKRLHPMDALAKLYFKMGRDEEGETLMQQIFEMADEFDAYFTPRVKTAMKYQLYVAKGDYEQAYKYWSQLELSNVDAEVIENTLESIMNMERHKQENMKEQADSLKALNEDMQSHMRQLESVNTDLQSYARTASHDLREPLRMISTYMTILSQKLNDKLSDDEQKFMHFAVDGARRMDDMITRILSAAKSQDVALRPVDLNRIASQAEQNLSKLAQEKNTLLTHDPLPIVMGDDIQLLQVIQNIVTNAIKYNASGQPKVHISFIKTDGKCILSIADNGVGIAESERENVFKMYQRVENSTGEDGTGIGLATVKRNIERMKGRIWIEGNEPNGCVFKIELPLAV